MALKKQLLEKFKEALFSVLPVSIIVLILSFIMVKDNLLEFITLFVIGTVLLVLGMTFFTLGADVSMMRIGQSIGSHITKSRKLWFVALICFILGVIVTIAEPDLRVLAENVPIVKTSVMIWAVAIGVGLFLMVSFFRVYLQIRLSYILIAMYVLAFVLAASPLIHPDFVASAFDSGGVTTGPITVPFIMALGVGLASVRGDKTSNEDSFGLVALCSIGPILTVLILGVFGDTSSIEAGPESTVIYQSVWEVLLAYVRAIPHYIEEVAVALSAIVAFFLAFQLISLRLPWDEVAKIGVGMLYTFLGLVLFLTGVNIGFMPVGTFIGQTLGDSTLSWLLIPIGALIGWFIVSAEPAVHVLKQQVEDVTEGAIRGKSVGFALAIGVSLSVALALLRVLTGLEIWWILVPGYLFSLVMTFFVPPIFTSIAFDAGGVASGPMTATFLLPLSLGACAAVGGNPLTDAFGLVAFVAMTPLVTIQLLGLIGKLKALHASRVSVGQLVLSDEIIELNFEEGGDLDA
ncbi:MAG: DUF1538 domain-containing protein [Clostridia bacterium]|nr:DUF1538 domain-containing protein [Clostridia bacterium]MBR2722217.1 DUF1538 domain-containing protein [Clostridia bacterium]